MSSFKDTLEFAKEEKNIDSLDKKIKHMKGFESLGKSIDEVSLKFSAFTVMGTTIIAKFTNGIINAGKAMVKSIFGDSVKGGWDEYELKMGSIQTVLSNMGKDTGGLRKVNAVMDDLNHYADKTVYNFGHMTEAMGKFKAAGIGIVDTSEAIKGLGNFAASSGATPEKMANATFAISQAMSTGAITSRYWRSIATADMGNKKFQDELMATAKSMGKTIDLTKGFQASLEDRWLTSKVMIKTLHKFAKDPDMYAAATVVKKVY